MVSGQLDGSHEEAFLTLPWVFGIVFEIPRSELDKPEEWRSRHVCSSTGETPMYSGIAQRDEVYVSLEEPE